MTAVFSRWLQYFDPLSKLEKQRRQVLQSGQCPNALLPLFETPCPDAQVDLDELCYLVIDFETTGFNPMVDNILSIAAVPMTCSTLKLAESRHHFIAQQAVKHDTAAINHIVPEMLQSAVALDEAMRELFSLMSGKIVIAHGSSIEKRFINHYLAVNYKMQSFPLLWLDTLKIERSFVAAEQRQNYQLATVRRSYRLPEYISHNALIDAIAAGELFAAQIIRLFGSQRKKLGEVYRRSL